MICRHEIIFKSYHKYLMYHKSFWATYTIETSLAFSKWHFYVTYLIIKSHNPQYRVCSPLTSSVAWHLLYMLRIKRWILYWGIASYSLISAWISCWRIWMCLLPSYTRRPSWSHKCSIGLKSGENAGPGNTCTLFCARKSLVGLAEWGLALSCW